MICKWCKRDRPPAKRGGLGCAACQRQRARYPRCALCDGPTYGAAPDARRRFCPVCSPRRPERAPRAGEVTIVLVNPRGEEREVYRTRKSSLPTHFRNGALLRHAKVNGRTPETLVLDTPWIAWATARTL